MDSKNASSATTLELLQRLQAEMPEVFEEAKVVGDWVWLEFSVPPLQAIRDKLKDFGFHWNSRRNCWQHPCGVPAVGSKYNPKLNHEIVTAADALPHRRMTKEYKVVALRECPLPESLVLFDTPEQAANYWRLHVTTNPYFNPEAECLVVLLLNTRNRIKGHQLLTIGTTNTLLVHAREVFRAAIITCASSVVLMHNHPSGESSPSDEDIKVTRDLVRAGKLMKIEVLDHVIMGNPKYSSLRELGYIYI